MLGHIVRPHVSYTEKSFELVGVDLVGGYALQPRWADGHSSGIYSFTYLRRLAQYSN
ncbi:MAG TPA: gamma-butyrobetaine hydroxylase-like domain-containing protein [Chthoniobacterales bacterium]